jgi:hypothetical protein
MTNMPPWQTEIKPNTILKIATASWQQQGLPRETLRELTVKHSVGTRVPPENVLPYLADMVAQTKYTLPAECKAYLDARSPSDPDDAIFATQEIADPIAEITPDNDADTGKSYRNSAEQPKSPLHIAALGYAARGWPVFPVHENAKAPACEHGFKDATTDVSLIDTWWEENPNYNVAACPDDFGCCVIDNDGGDIASLDLPPTYEVSTPRGGRHYFFEGKLPPTAGKLGEKIDTRGENSYVLLSPSVVNGRTYSVEYDRPIAALPQAIKERLETQKVEPRKAAEGVEMDEDHNVRGARVRLRDLVKAGKISIQGRAGDNTAYEVANIIRVEFGLTKEVTFQVMWEEWNPHCRGPWSAEELQTKVFNAYEYGQDATGAKARKSAEETFEKREQKQEDAHQQQKDDTPRSRYAPMNLRAVIKRPPTVFWDRERLWAKTPQGCVTVPFGDKGILKTSLMVRSMALAVLENDDAKGYYAAGEQGEDVVATRLIPILQSLKHEGLNVTIDDLLATGRFFVGNTAPIFASNDEMESFFSELAKINPNLITIDTLTRASPGQTFDTETMTTAYNCCDQMRQRFKANVSLIHHSGKDGVERGAKGDSALEHNADVVIELTSPQKNVTKAFVKHSRLSADGYNVFFKWTYFPHPWPAYSKDQSKAVPVPVPMSTAEGQAVADKAAINGHAYKWVQEQALTVLRKKKLTDPFETFYSTIWLAKDIASLNYSGPVIRTAAAQAEFDTKVAAIAKKLDNGAGTQEKPGKLAFMVKYRLPNGAKPESKKLARSWFCPPEMLNPEDLSLLTTPDKFKEGK